MAPFVFPANLSDLEQEPEEEQQIFVQNPIDVSVFTSSEVEEIVKGVAFDLSDKELFCVEEQVVFDQIYSLVKGFSLLNPSAKLNLVESLRSNFSVLLPNVDSLSRSPCSQSEISLQDRVLSHRNALKIYTFFLQTIVLAEETNLDAQARSSNSNPKATQIRKKPSAQSWNWEAQRGRIITLLANSLETNLSLLFGMSDPEENYLSFVVKGAFTMFEIPSLLKDSDTKDALCRIIGTCATKYHFTTQASASILHLIYKFDFLVVHMADAVAWAEKKYSDGSLGVSLIREIGRTNPKDYLRDTVGADNIGRFLVELADRLPKLMVTNIGILVPHFGGESYKIRNALVGVLGKLISKAFKDVDGDSSGKSLQLRSKQAMLEILLERCRDVSAYTRSRVLQVWAELCEEHALSIGLWNEVAVVAAGRLDDKSAIVRKSALNLLITMLQYNPFGPQLRTTSFEATLEKYNERLRKLLPVASSENTEQGETSESIAHIADSEAAVDSAAGIDGLGNQADSASDSCLPSMGDGVEMDRTPDVGNLEQTRALVASLEAGLRFSKCVMSTMPALVQLMASSSATDVENAILLLMRCRQFQIDGSEACLRKMLPLAFSQDKAIYEAVEGAFITIYLRKNPTETAGNLLNLAIESSIGDLAALEFIVSSLVAKGDISTSMISALWDFFSFNVNGVTAEQSRGALTVLCMAAKSSAKVLSSHLQDIIDIGFGRWAKEDPLLARTACIALQRLSEEDKEKLVSSGSKVFSILQSLINGFRLPENIWYTAADKAISAIYAIHPTPETLAADVVKRAHNSILDCNVGDELPNGFESGGTTSSTGNHYLSTVQVAKLSKYFFVISHVALNQLVYIESCVRKIQKQKTKKERSKTESQDVQSGDSSEASLKDNGINAELGLAASEDALLDSLSERAEKEIVSGGCVEKNLIGLCAPFLSKLCRNFSLMQKFPELQASGMLALCKLMIVDAEFCEANLQLLFTVVESAPTETVRSNCSIALGDLAVRFPNLLEPWTEKVYARLRDPSISVRKNAVLVLSHLILNDMMKVKGYINEMAMRLEDEDERISNLSKLFFHELSKKGSNPIYNLLPDILGRLSNQNLKDNTFCNIMQFLIGSIKKDKQMEALVEKLCNRFAGVSDVKQWEYIAYCLSQLTFTERGMKRLIESFKSYEHALSEESVMEHYRNIISKSKKFAKPELKSCIEEFEEKLNKFHLERKEQELAAMNAQAHQQKINSFDGLMASRDGSVDEGSREDIVSDGDGEVINHSSEDRRSQIHNAGALEEAESVEREEGSSACSTVTASESGDMEVQSPRISQKGTCKSKAKKDIVGRCKEQAKVDGSVRRSTRATRR